MDLHHQARVLQIDKALDVSPSKFDKDNLKKHCCYIYITYDNVTILEHYAFSIFDSAC